MTTISDIKLAFYDSQRKSSDLVDVLVSEILELNKKLKEATDKEEPPKEKKAKA